MCVGVGQGQEGLVGMERVLLEYLRFTDLERCNFNDPYKILENLVLLLWWVMFGSSTTQISQNCPGSSPGSPLFWKIRQPRETGIVRYPTKLSLATPNHHV